MNNISAYDFLREKYKQGFIEKNQREPVSDNDWLECSILTNYCDDTYEVSVAMRDMEYGQTEVNLILNFPENVKISVCGIQHDHNPHIYWDDIRYVRTSASEILPELDVEEMVEYIKVIMQENKKGDVYKRVSDYLFYNL